MSWEDYSAYKKDGTKTSAKAPWIYEYWDSVNLTKEQYTLGAKVENRAVMVMSTVFLCVGVILGVVLTNIIKWL